MNDSLNKSLKVFRTFHRLNQTELAEKLDVSKSFISEIESGKRVATLKLVNKYADVFNVSASEILFLAENYENQASSFTPSNIILKMMDWISNDDVPVDSKTVRGRVQRI